jgi:hypothetical protein
MHALTMIISNQAGILMSVAAFSLAGLAGSLLTEKDPIGVILYSLKRRGLGFVVTSLGAGFAAALLWKVLHGAAQ